MKVKIKSIVSKKNEQCNKWKIYCFPSALMHNFVIVSFYLLNRTKTSQRLRSISFDPETGYPTLTCAFMLPRTQALIGIFGGRTAEPAGRPDRGTKGPTAFPTLHCARSRLTSRVGIQWRLGTREAIVGDTCATRQYGYLTCWRSKQEEFQKP